MADTLMGITEVTAASLAEISSDVQSYLQQKSFLLPTVSDYSYLATPGTKSVSVPKSGGFTVASKSENTAASATALTYSVDTIALTNHRYVQFLLEDYADIKAKINVVGDSVLKATADLAKDVDSYIVAELKLASASAPDHQIVFTDTSGDVIAKGDILAARKLLQDQYIDPRECYIGIGPEKENEMLALADFIQAERYGSNMPVMMGEFGRVFGMKVIVSTLFSDFMCVWHPSAVGFAFQQGLRFQSQPDLANLGIRYSLDMIHGAEVLDSGKRNVLVDSTN